MTHEYQWKIGDCSIQLITSVSQQIEGNFLPFTDEGAEKTIVYFKKADCFFDVPGPDLVSESDVMFSEYYLEQEYIRTFHGTGTKEPYAVLRKADQNKWECVYLQEFEYHFQTIGNCFRHIALERILMDNKTMILHASFVNINGEGLLFTGRSGIGKSTQAELWRSYENAEIINGDRTILCKKKGIWNGYGSPYAGSSNVYINADAPIKAIIVLEQSLEEDSCIRLTPGKAFGCIYAGITLNTWNGEYMAAAINLIHDLCITVPIFRLRCRPEYSAVNCLKQTLAKIGGR